MKNLHMFKSYYIRLNGEIILLRNPLIDDPFLFDIHNNFFKHNPLLYIRNFIKNDN